MDPAEQVFESISTYHGRRFEDMCEGYQNALRLSVSKVVVEAVDTMRMHDRSRMACLDEKLAATITKSMSLQATAEEVAGVLMEFFTAFNLGKTLMAMMNAALRSKVTTGSGAPNFPFPRD